MVTADDFGLDVEGLCDRLARPPVGARSGKVQKVVGMVVEATVPDAGLGTVCELETSAGGLEAEVVGFRDHICLLMPLGDLAGVRLGDVVRVRHAPTGAPVSSALLGRVLDGRGQPLDGRPLPPPETSVSLHGVPSNPMRRRPIREPLSLGVRAIDGLLTAGRGQRIGIMAGSGVGKSVLLGMMARNAKSDVNVIALVGERGREVREFIEKDLGPAGLARSVIICATSDSPPLLRMRAAWLATAIAEFFRDQGKSVLLLMDSVTRFAMAQREIGLAVGEPPTTRGYTPSVFGLLPRLLERAGTTDGPGSITGLYTVLVEQDDLNDPIGDAVRSIVDGHIVLSRDLAARNHFPAIDVLASASRVMTDVTSAEHQRAAGVVRELLATHRKSADLINIGAWQKGANPMLDRAVAQLPAIDRMLVQAVSEPATLATSLAALQAIAAAGAAGPGGAR